MPGDVDPNATVEHVGQNDEDDPFHDRDGTPVLDDATAFEVGLYAHHCWILGLDPDRTAALLRGA